MCLSSTANLYYGVRYDQVFKTIETRQEYDLHDLKSGLKTGKKGFDVIKQVQNIFTNEIFNLKDEYCNLFPELKNEVFLFNMTQDGPIIDQVIGIHVACHDEYANNDYSVISEKKLEIAKNKFEKKFRKHIGDLKPALMLNLYHGY